MKISEVKREFQLQQWRGMVLEWKESGLSVKDWCSERGITEHVYYYRLRHLRIAACQALQETQPVQLACHARLRLPTRFGTLVIMNAKYTNAIPLYRIAQDFEQNDMILSRATMANWVIRCAERCLSPVYDRLRTELCSRHVLQVDETTCQVTKDGRSSNTKSYMFVYRTSEYCHENPVILYQYAMTRSRSNVQRFLNGFSGVLESDAFSGYKALVQIAAIYKADEAYKDKTTQERYNGRQENVKPLVEAYFAWVREQEPATILSEKTRDGLKYSLNQEEYLKVFLEDGRIPIDNSATERAIRPFTVGRDNWHIIDAVQVAEVSAMVYSLVETAKANKLKIYEYLKHLLTEIPKHMDDTSLDFLEDLLPWSENLPEECRKQTSYNQRGSGKKRSPVNFTILGQGTNGWAFTNCG